MNQDGIPQQLAVQLLHQWCPHSILDNVADICAQAFWDNMSQQQMSHFQPSWTWRLFQINHGLLEVYAGSCTLPPCFLWIGKVWTEESTAEQPQTALGGLTWVGALMRETLYPYWKVPPMPAAHTVPRRVQDGSYRKRKSQIFKNLSHCFPQPRKTHHEKEITACGWTISNSLRSEIGSRKPISNFLIHY